MPITFLDEEEDVANNISQTIPTTQPTGRKITYLDDEPTQEVGTLQGIANAAQNAFDSSRQSLLAVGGVDKDQAEQISKLEYAKKSRQLAPDYAEYQKAEGWDAVGAFLKNPIEVTTNIVAEGLAGSLPALGAGVTSGLAGAGVGSVVPGLGTGIGFTAGQVAGTFAGSLATEYGGKVIEELQNAGMDMSDPQSVQKYFSDEALMSPARDKALLRGVPVAAFDAVSAGIGGKLGRVLGSKVITEGEKIIGKQFATKTGEALTELGVQAGLGAGGEVAGALAIGETPSVKAAFGEAIGEVGTGGIQVLTGRIADRRMNIKTAEEKARNNVLDLSETLEANNSPLTAQAIQNDLAATLAEQAKEEEAAKANAAAKLQAEAQAAYEEKPPVTTPIKEEVVTPTETLTPLTEQAEVPATTFRDLVISSGIPEEAVDSYIENLKNQGLDETQIAEMSNNLRVLTQEANKKNEEDAAMRRDIARRARAGDREARAKLETERGIVSEEQQQATGREILPVTQPTEQPQYATTEIIQPEGVRQEPQDRTQGQPTNETIARNRVLDTEGREVQGQVATVVNDLQAVADNTATPEQLTALSQSGLVDIVQGQPVINESGQSLLIQAEAPLPKLTPAERRAEIVAEPTIGEIPQTSPMIGEQPATIVEKSAPSVTPAVSEAPAAEVAPIQRDMTKPEQMTPKEWKESRKKAEGNIYSGAVAEYQQKGVINNAIKQLDPVSVASVDEYGIKPPKGYVKQGDLYIYQKATPAVAEPKKARFDSEYVKSIRPIVSAMLDQTNSSEIITKAAGRKLSKEQEIDVVVEWARRLQEQGELALPSDFNMLEMDQAYMVEPALSNLGLLEKPATPASAALAAEPPVITPAPVSETPAVTEAPAAEVAPTPAAAEQIAATAVIDKDGKILSSPSKTHAQIMEETKFNLDAGEFPPTQNFGFVTTTGRFVQQKEAQQIAQKAKQVQGNQSISGEIVSGLQRQGMLPTPEVSEAPAAEVAPATQESFGQRMLNAVNEKIAQGKDVFISTMTKSTKVNKKAVDNWNKAGKPLFKVGKDGNLYIGSGKRYDQLTSADMSLVGFSSEGKKLVVAEPTPAVSETKTPTTPEVAPTTTGIKVGDKVTNKNNTTITYTVEEVLPQTDAERENGEQQYSVRNKKGGLEIVGNNDIQPFKGVMRKRKLAKAISTQAITPGVSRQIPAKYRSASIQTKVQAYINEELDALQKFIESKEVLTEEDQEIADNIQNRIDNAKKYNFHESELMDQADLEQGVQDFFNGEIPDRVVFIDDIGENYRASYDVKSGEILINRAYFLLGQNIDTTLGHELAHFAFGNDNFRAQFMELWDGLTQQARDKISSFVEEHYSDYDKDALPEEKVVTAFQAMLEANPEIKTLWDRFVDLVVSTYRKLLNKQDYIPRNASKLALDLVNQLRQEYIAGVEYKRPDGSPFKFYSRENRAQVNGEPGIGNILTSAPKLFENTDSIVKQYYFDSTIVNPENRNQAFLLLHSLRDRDYAVSINKDIKNKIGGDFKEQQRAVVGVVRLKNALKEFADRLALSGDPSFLRKYNEYSNQIDLGIEDVNATNIATALSAISSKSQVSKAADILKEGESAQVASTLFGTSSPTIDQTNVVKAGIDAVNEVKVNDADILDEIGNVESRTGVNIRAKVDKQIETSNKPQKSIVDAAYSNLKKSTQKPRGVKRTTLVTDNVKEIVSGNLTNYRQSLIDQSADGLQSDFWQTMSNQERKQGPLAELDQAQNKELAKIVRDALVKAGLKGEPPNTKMTDIEKVASILSEQKLSLEKQAEVDKRITQDINDRRNGEISQVEDEDSMDAINDKYDAIQAAWDEAMARQTNMPVSDIMIRRLLSSEMKEAKISVNEIAQLRQGGQDLNKKSIIDSLMSKIYGVSKESQTGIEIDEDYSNLRSYLENELNNLVDIQTKKIDAANALAEARRAEQLTPDYKASQIIEKMAAEQEGLGFANKPQENQVRDIVQQDLRSSPNMENKDGWRASFVERLMSAGVSQTNAEILADITWTQHERNALSKDLKQQEIDANRPNKQADALIKSFSEKLAGIDTIPKQSENQIRSILDQDLRQRPDMGRKEAWKSMLIAKIMNAGASEARAQILADLTWRQHEINSLNREIKEIETAATKGSLGVILERIKNTPLSEQATPEWRKKVILDYLKSAGLSEKQAETAAKLYDNIISEKIAEAQQKAFEDAISTKAPWKTYASRNGQLAKTALNKILNAVRVGALDPTQTAENIIAKQNGWAGFSNEDYKTIAQMDEVLSNKDSDEIQKAEAMKKINDIISKAKLPVTIKQALAAYYTAQALSGVPTLTVNIFSPAITALRNFTVDMANSTITDPSKIPIIFDFYLESMRSWYNQVKFSFKNEIYPNDVVEYLNGTNSLKELYNRGKTEWAKGNYASGLRDMLIGSTQITGRVLSALDQGAISALENQAIGRYALEAMTHSNIPKKQRNDIANMILHSKREMYAEFIASGMDKDRAGVLSDIAMKQSIQSALSDLKLNSDDVLDASINDALLSVGRNKTLDADGFADEQKRLTDDGVFSYFPIKFLEQIASNAAQAGPAMQIFSKMLYGFALVPARATSFFAWFSPYGFVRLGIDKYKKNKGEESPYALSLGNDLQRRQRLNEAIAGSLVMLTIPVLASASTDDDDEKFKIVITGAGPDANADKQYRDSWLKKYSPYTIHIVYKNKTTKVNFGRGGEAIMFPLIAASVKDDWMIKQKLNLAKKNPADLNQASTMIGSAFLALAQRGPYAAFGKSLFDATKSGQTTQELAGQAAYMGKTFIPIFGSSLARNISDFMSDPVDKSSMAGAMYSNIPIVGPMIGSRALNAFGQPIRADDWSDRMFRLGVPMVFSFPANSPMNELNELVLKKGDGPTIPTRVNAEKKMGRILTDKEFESYVSAYGEYVSKAMFSSRKSLERMRSSDYSSQLQDYSNDASDRAVRIIKRMYGQ